MSKPDSSPVDPIENAPEEDASERELSLEDLDDVAGGAVMHERTNEENRK